MRLHLLFLTGLLAALLPGCLDAGPFEPHSEPGPGTVAASGERAVASLSETSPEEVVVFTRNLYLGGDIGPLLDPSANPVEAASAVWNEIQRTDYPARAARLAGEIAERRPDLVGLQEVTTFTIGPFPSAFPETVLVDFLDLLQGHLALLGESYTVAIRQANSQIAVPVMLGTELVTIGYRDGGAILVRDGVSMANAQAHHFTARPPLELTANIPFIRGWTQVDARVGGGWLRFVNTHLEIQSFAAVQEMQSAELLASLAGSPHPVILVGDFNSAANPSAPADRKTGSYEMILAAGFDDLWTRSNHPDAGFTCCHASDLSNETATFDQRLDLVFARNVPGSEGGYAGSAFLEVVGGSPDDRFDAEAAALWPSDHAGVAAALRLPQGLFAAH